MLHFASLCPKWGIVKVETTFEPKTEEKILPTVHCRVEGVTAKRIERLAKRTSISVNRIANMAAEAGIAAIEKRFRE